jgi:hypothetical protein
MSPFRIDRAHCMKGGVVIVRQKQWRPVRSAQDVAAILALITMQPQTPTVEPESRATNPLTQNLSFIAGCLDARFGSSEASRLVDWSTPVLKSLIESPTPTSLAFLVLVLAPPACHQPWQPPTLSAFFFWPTIFCSAPEASDKASILGLRRRQ